MIQCYQCEDWFHNQHLTPKLEEDVDEKYILLCKDCVGKHFMNTLNLYKNYFHPDSLDFMCANPEDLTRLKRQKCELGTSLNKSRSRVQCTMPQETSVDKHSGEPSLLPFDVLIDENFLEALCQCETCQKSYSKLQKLVTAMNNMSSDDRKLLNNLDGKINEDEEEKRPPMSPERVATSPQSPNSP